MAGGRRQRGSRVRRAAAPRSRRWLRDRARPIASLYGPRQWCAIVAGIPAAIWCYGAIGDVTRVYDPPPASTAPALGFVVLTDGDERPVDHRFTMEVDIASRGC